METMVTGVGLTMETMGVVMVLTGMLTGVGLITETTDLIMGDGGIMMITGVVLVLITMTMDLTMDLTMGDGVTMMTMRVGPTTVIMVPTMEIIALTMKDGEIMTVGLRMEIMAQITTAGKVVQAIGETMKHRTIGATMETPHLTQTSFPPPRWKS